MIPSAILEHYVVMGRKHRLKCLTIEGATIEFGDPFEVVDPNSATGKALAEKIGMEHGNPTEDELLFMSAPDGPPDDKAFPP